LDCRCCWCGYGTLTIEVCHRHGQLKAFATRSKPGRGETVVELPGFTRGWALVGSYALVGLSKVRPTSAMDGVPIAEHRDDLKCGVAVVDLRRGASIALLEFQTAIEEIFDLQLFAGLRFP